MLKARLGPGVCANLGLGLGTGVGCARASLSSIRADVLLSASPLGSVMMVLAILPAVFYLRSHRRTLSHSLLFNP